MFATLYDKDAELGARARDYLRAIGMEDHEIKALRDKLAGSGARR